MATDLMYTAHKYLIYFFLYSCSYISPVIPSRITPPPQETYTYNEGSSLSLTWKYTLDINHNFFGFKCGRQNATRTQVLDGSDVIVLAEIKGSSQSTPASLASPMPLNYVGRVRVTQPEKTSLTLTIERLTGSDTGYYLCALKIFNNKISRVQTIRSTRRLLRSSDGVGAQSSDGGSKKRTIVLVAVLVVLALAVIAVVVGVLIYRRKVKKDTTTWSKGKKQEAEPMHNNNKKRVTRVDQNDDGNGYAKVQVVSTPEEALNGKKIVYVDDDDDDDRDGVDPNGFV